MEITTTGTAARLLGGALTSLALAACGGESGPAGGEPTSGRPPAPDPASGQNFDGRYVGTVDVDGESLFADALLTRDGALRLYVGGPGSGGGALQVSKPGGSVQFVGQVPLQGTSISGAGRVFGQDCAPPDIVPFCAETAEASISLDLGSDTLRGVIEVSTPAGTETWSLDLAAWRNYYELPALPDGLAGHYREVLAEFERDGDVIVAIDAAGQLFFQGSSSGCTGNGEVSPHLDGEANVYDVHLTIASCNATYAHLNGTYAGFATTTPSGYWDYDSLLRVWLSTSDPDAHAAITMLGR